MWNQELHRLIYEEIQSPKLLKFFDNREENTREKERRKHWVDLISGETKKIEGLTNEAKRKIGLPIRRLYIGNKRPHDLQPEIKENA